MVVVEVRLMLVGVAFVAKWSEVGEAGQALHLREKVEVGALNLEMVVEAVLELRLLYLVVVEGLALD